MQYELNIDTCKKTKEKRKLFNLDNELMRVLGTFVTGILISRVVLYLNTEHITGIAPFGIAYLLAIIVRKDVKSSIGASVGAIIGYSTITIGISDRYINLISIAILLVYSFVLNKANKSIKEIYAYGLIIASYFIYGAVVSKYDIGVNITISLLNTIVILPIYYVIKYGIACIEEFNTNYFFSVEEMISIGLVVCLIISGIGDFEFFNISIRNIFAYGTILLVAYIGGATYGATIGVSMGMLIGMNSGDILNCITFYSISGLVAGMFKDTGKIFTFLSYVIIYFTLSLYISNLNIYSLSEVCLGGVIFFVFPKVWLRALQLEVNVDEKKVKVNEVELNELKEEFTDKVKHLESALVTVSNTLNTLNDNDKLMYKNKSAALIENLADRVCSKCFKCDKCWKRDFNTTYSAFESLITSYETGKVIFPNALEKMCLYKFQLIKDTGRVVENLTSKQEIKEKLGEGRHLLANHVQNISYSVGEMLTDFKENVSICEDIERRVRRALNKNVIHYNKLFCYRDSNGRVKIKLRMQSCGGSKLCSKEILPIINKATGALMCIGGDGCRINPVNNECVVVFEECPKYHIVSYGAVAVKDGEEYSGDTFSFGKTKDGSYITLISDGMGSGPEASKESRTTVELVENFIEAGFEKDTTINMVNSVMAMKFEEDEKFSTLDLNVVDLHSGTASFIKVGAAASFIKSGKNITPIVSNMPPFGLVDKVEVEEIRKQVKNGDLIVTISDGILDINKESLGKYEWLEKYLVDSSREPKQLAGDILDRAKELSGEKVKDDMTVVVSRVYSNY